MYIQHTPSASRLTSRARPVSLFKLRCPLSTSLEKSSRSRCTFGRGAVSVNVRTSAVYIRALADTAARATYHMQVRLLPNVLTQVLQVAHANSQLVDDLVLVCSGAGRGRHAATRSRGRERRAIRPPAGCVRHPKWAKSTRHAVQSTWHTLLGLLVRL